jgi:hypothetical protein
MALRNATISRRSEQSAGKTQQSLDILYRLQGSRTMDAVTPVA